MSRVLNPFSNAPIEFLFQSGVTGGASLLIVVRRFKHMLENRYAK